MNVHDPAGTRNVTPRRASTDLVAALERLVDVDGLDHHGEGSAGRERSSPDGAGRRQRHVTLCRIASIGVIRDAFHAG